MLRWVGLLVGMSACVPVSPDNATLRSLRVGDVEPWPAFEPDRTAYAVARSEIGGGDRLELETTDPNASVDIFVEDVDGRSREVDVAIREADRFVAVVTSADGTKKRRYEVVFLPDAFPDPDLRTVEGEEPAEGYLFVGAMRDDFRSYNAILDDGGVPRWFRRISSGIFDFAVRRDGRVGWMSHIDDGDVFAGQVVDNTWSVVETIRPLELDDGTQLEVDVHEFMRLPNGHRVSLGEYVDAADMSDHRGTPYMWVLHQVIQEVDAFGNVVFEWSPRDHLDWKDSEVWSPDTSTGAIGYAHVNAFDIDPDDGSWLVSARLRNQILKVAREPMELGGRSYEPGEIVWRLGGTDSDFTFVDDPRADGREGFFGQHTVRGLEGNRLMLFDNALFRRPTEDLTNPSAGYLPTGDARAVEYELDTEAWTATRVREVTLEGEGEVRAAGSVQALPNGGLLVGWGDRSRAEPTSPMATEFGPDGQIVQQLFMTPGTWSYRVSKAPFTLPWDLRLQ